MSEQDSQPKVVEIRLREGRDLRQLWLDGLENGGVFIAGAFSLSVGVPVRVRVTTESPVASTFLEGTVVWRRQERASSSGAPCADVGIAFAETVRPCVDFLSRLAKGAAIDRRAAIRFATDVRGDVRVLTAEGTSHARFIDVAGRGARMVLTDPLSVRRQTLVEIKVSSDNPCVGLLGRVAWSSGDTLGVRLLLATEEERMVWTKVVTRARTSEDLSTRSSNFARLAPPPPA